MLPLIIALLIPVAAIALIIYIIVRRRKIGKSLAENENDYIQVIPLWKGFVYQLAPIAGGLMILVYFITKQESNFKLNGGVGIIFWIVALALISMYRKSGFRFEKSNNSSFGIKLIAYKAKK